MFWLPRLPSFEQNLMTFSTVWVYSNANT